MMADQARLAMPAEPALMERPLRKGRATLFSRIDFDYIFVTFVFLCTIFTRFLPGIGPVLLIGAAGLYFVQRPNKLRALSRCAGPAMIVLYVLLSTLWSEDPARTLYFGAQYGLTILLACQIGTGLDERKLMLGLFSAFLAFAVSNLFIGIVTHSLFLFAFSSHVPFTGLLISKNSQGDVTAIGTMVAVTTLIFALRQRKFTLALVSFVMLPFNMLVLANAQSTGAIVAAAVGTLTILALTTLRALPVQARFLGFFGTLVAAACVIATRPLWYEPLFENVLKVAGKDSSLTGRTYIWERAEVAISQHPLLGVGYSAFWRVGSLEPEAIWRRLQIHSRSGFNFHNTYYDIRVDLGLVGVLLYAAIFLPMIISLVIRTVRHPSPLTIMFTSLIAYEASRFQFESIAFQPIFYPTLILFTALAWSTRSFAGEIDAPTLRRRTRRPLFLRT